jgi:hypothetical protein
VIIDFYLNFELLRSLSTGLLVMVILFAITWILGVFALVRFPGSEIPNFYPIFQVIKYHLKAN